jgi:hypothetical protein
VRNFTKDPQDAHLILRIETLAAEQEQMIAVERCAHLLRENFIEGLSEIDSKHFGS